MELALNREVVPLEDSSKELSSSSESLRPEERSDDSGYLSDANDSPSSDSSSEIYCVYDSENDDEEIDSHIEYIQEKQRILKRAADVLYQEDAYTASIALNKPSATEGTIWQKAQGILRSLDQKPGDNETSTMRPPPARRGPVGGSLVKKNQPCPTDASIDTSTVQRISASSFATSTIEADKGEELALLSSLAAPLFADSQWMAQALVWSAPSHPSIHALQDCRWQVMSDPLTCCLGLIPPSSMSMQNAVDIQEATCITQNARLVTQSTPPFNVVFANKAFLQVAGLSSNGSLIGKPVETLLHVTQDIHDSDTDTTYLDSVLTLTDNKSCRIRAVPVVDRARRRKLSDSSCACMTHVMIEVVEGSVECGVAESDTISAISDSSGNQEKQDHRESPRDHPGNHHQVTGPEVAWAKDTADGRQAASNSVLGTVG